MNSRSLFFTEILKNALDNKLLEATGHHFRRIIFEPQDVWRD
jgi:hypothetical protein